MRPFLAGYVFIYLALAFGPTDLLAGLEAKEPAVSFQLQAGNRIEVTVYREEDLSGVYEIDPTGNLTFPLIGEIPAAGLEIEDFRALLVLKLKKYLVQPQVTVFRAEGSSKSISVLGHVQSPGVYEYQPGMTLMRVISASGGYAISANKKKTKIIRNRNGKKEVSTVNAMKIIDGTTNDPSVESGDIVFVPESIF